MLRRSKATSAQRRVAWLAIGLYVCAAYVSPALHGVGHKADHTHSGDGLERVAVRLASSPGPAPHSHGGSAPHVHHAAPADDAIPTPDNDDGHPTPPLEHGRGSLDHFAAGLLPTAPVLVVPQCPVQQVHALATPVDFLSPRRCFSMASPRGPPSSLG